jgi:hypothetical protein
MRQLGFAAALACLACVSERACTEITRTWLRTAEQRHEGKGGCRSHAEGKWRGFGSMISCLAPFVIWLGLFHLAGNMPTSENLKLKN